MALSPPRGGPPADRFVPFTFPRGNVPKDEGRRENAYASGFAGIDPDLCRLDFRGGARRPFPGRGAAGRGVVAPRRFLRRREPSAPCVSDQPVHRLSEDRCRYLQAKVKGGTVLQMDKGASADQVLLRHFGQRRDDPGLGGHHRLPSRRHCKETPEIATKSPYATSNRGSEPVRENRYHSTGYEGIKARNHGRNPKPVQFSRS